MGNWKWVIHTGFSVKIWFILVSKLCQKFRREHWNLMYNKMWVLLLETKSQLEEQVCME